MSHKKIIVPLVFIILFSSANILHAGFWGFSNPAESWKTFTIGQFIGFLGLLWAGYKIKSLEHQLVSERQNSRQREREIKNKFAMQRLVDRAVFKTKVQSVQADYNKLVDGNFTQDPLGRLTLAPHKLINVAEQSLCIVGLNIYRDFVKKSELDASIGHHELRFKNNVVSSDEGAQLRTELLLLRKRIDELAKIERDENYLSK